MTFFYSPSCRGFFHDAMHGARTVPDPDAVEGAGAAEVANPKCRIPSDAVEISDACHAELMDAQSGGKSIAPGDDGAPVAIDRPAPTPEEIWAAVRARRNKLLQNSDWTQLPDALAATRKAWATRRQALRDIPTQPDPSNIDWGHDPIAEA